MPPSSHISVQRRTGLIPRAGSDPHEVSLRSSRHKQPEPAGHRRELDEPRVPFHHLKASLTQLFVNDLDRDVVLRDLFVPF
jgi:hypothetical protein